MPDESSQNLPVAGWYPDPAGGPRSRWWDGTAWTEHFQDPYSTSAVAPKAPEGTRVYNLWIWLICFLLCGSGSLASVCRRVSPRARALPKPLVRDLYDRDA